MHGGLKFYRGTAAAARSYVEADRSRVDDYYLAEGTGLATRYVACPAGEGRFGSHSTIVSPVGEMDGPTYERWVAGYLVETGRTKGRLRTDNRGLRFVEFTVNGPKTYSLAATLHPEIAAAYDAAQGHAAQEVLAWVAEHATTRVGPRGRQVQIPVDRLEAAVVRHYTSRAGDPHRHLHVQVSSRVHAAGAWRGLHSAGVVDSIEAINGIGQAAIACDPGFRQALAAHGYTLDPATGEIAQLAAYVGDFSARAGQITRNIDRYEAQWRTEHPGENPGPKRRRAWDRRAWAQARPDKVIPKDGAELRRRWVQELYEAGFTPPAPPPHPKSVDVGTGELSPAGTPVGRLNRDAVAELVISRLGSRRSAWNAADIRGEAERIVAALNVIAHSPVRRELVEDLTGRTLQRCVPLLDRDDVPEHVRALTSERVLEVEKNLIDGLVYLNRSPGTPVPESEMDSVLGDQVLDPDQRRVVAALAGTGKLLLVEGAAGAGKTATLRAATNLLAAQRRRLMVVTPTLKAARVAQEQVGTHAFSAAWLIHQHGYRWDEDGHRTREFFFDPGPLAQLKPHDVLVIDEAGMLDQDTAEALFNIAHQARAKLVFMGDRHQLPAVGRGGVVDHVARWGPRGACLELGTVHRFTDTEYADLTLLMRTGERSGEVFDALLRRGEVIIHRSDVERFGALTTALTSDRGTLGIADTREQVAALNAAVRDHRLSTTGESGGEVRSWTTVDSGGQYVTTRAGAMVGVGDRVTTRLNDRYVDVANRDTWTVTDIRDDGSLAVNGRPGERILPPSYVRDHVELAYATTVHGAQGDTVDNAHFVLGETTGAAAAYVAMTRGRHHNTAHLVADSLDEARAQWIDTFNRDRADLGPAHAADVAAESIERYGPQARERRREALYGTPSRRSSPPRPAPKPSRGISF